MRSIINKFAVVVAVFLLGLVFVGGNVYADDSDDSANQNAAMSISISPVSKILQLSSSSSYDDTFKVTNNSNSPMDFEVYAAPYSYNYSEDNNSYSLGFNKENNFTQITRWITFRDASGNYVEKATFKADPNSDVEIAYRITTPASIPAGGQYAVLFAHTLSSTENSNGIRTEASPGLVVYGRAEGAVNISGEIKDLEIKSTMPSENGEKTVINATSKVKNTGNVDFMASGTLKVTGIFGQTYYETPSDSTKSRISVIPESELTVSDSWDDTPFFGLFNVSWKVTAGSTNNESITKFVIIMPPILIIVVILLLTILIVWITIMVRKRKERRSRFMV